MSADNYFEIIRVEGEYRGYMQYVSDPMTLNELLEECEPSFVAKTVEEAIEMAQAEYTEYGYRFINVKDDLSTVARKSWLVSIRVNAETKQEAKELIEDLLNYPTCYTDDYKSMFRGRTRDDLGIKVEQVVCKDPEEFLRNVDERQRIRDAEAVYFGTNYC